MEQIDIQGSTITVTTSYAFVDICRRIPGGRWNSERKCWQYPLHGDTASRIDKVFPAQVKRTPAFTGWLQQNGALQREQEAIRTAEELPDIPVTKTKPWLHQQRAYWFANPLKGAMLALDMGAGKSKVVIDLIQNRGHKNVLILCPKKVVGVWPTQFERHCAVKYQIVALKEGSTTVRTTQAKAFLHRTTEADTVKVVVINYDAARNDPFAKWALEQEWDLLVMDESHKIKAPGGQTSRFCHTLSKRAKYRLALTGTPLPHSPLDGYAQMRAVDETVFGTSFARFKNQYAIMGGYMQYQVIGYQNTDEYNKRFYSRAIKIGKEVLDLPPLHHIRPPDGIEYAELSREARDIYNEMEEEFIADFGGEKVEASNALVQLLRLHQIAGGWLAGQKVDTGKEELLEELLESIEGHEPVVVFAEFRDELAVIKEVGERLGYPTYELSGKLDELEDWTERCKLSEDGWLEERKRAPLLAVQIRAGGVGIDLTAARYCIYYSKGFSLGDYEQSLARIHRPGQTRSTMYYHLLTRGTVDIKIEKALQNRKDVVTAILAEGLR